MDNYAQGIRSLLLPKISSLRMVWRNFPLLQGSGDMGVAVGGKCPFGISPQPLLTLGASSSVHGPKRALDLTHI